jgi:DNA-binding CsgD family transcriptional regulator
MKDIDWLEEPASLFIQQRTKEKIRTVQTFEEEFPSVFIIHDLVTNKVVYMSKRGRDVLGVTLDEIRLSTPEYTSKYFNEEDATYYVPKIFGLIERNEQDEAVSFFQQVRPSPQHNWDWYLSSTKVFLRDENEKPRLVITLAVKVDVEHPISIKVSRLLEENNFFRNNRQLFSTLTNREKEILKLMALGQSSMEISARLHISEATANTHRRNIRNKIKAESNYDITRFARAFDLI